MIEKNLRILIPAKGNSMRAPGKNELLLPYTMEYILRLGKQKQTWLMTECQDLAALATGVGIMHLPEMTQGNDFAPNFTASYRAAGWADDDLVALLEPTKPFRQRWLLDACLEQYEKNAGKVVTTGVEQTTTFISWDGARAMRYVGSKILDCCVVVTKCGVLSRVQTMSEFWEDGNIEVVWHEAPSGIDFDWPSDLECHLPTVSRLWEKWYNKDR